MKRFLLLCLSLSFGLLACGEGRSLFQGRRYPSDAAVDGSKPASKDAGLKAGVCQLSKCPTPAMGLACCMPNAQCGMDTTGLGLNCVPLPGQTYASDSVCVLNECPTPTVGTRCCTPFAQCGFDPLGTGQFCFAFPVSNADAGTAQPTCDLTKCPEVDDGGPAACCLANGNCGFDSLGVGVCIAPSAALPPDMTSTAQPPATRPPDDPSITGECPSYLDTTGPVWGCCSDYGVCGTFDLGTCLLPAGTEIPVALPTDEDGGAKHAYPLCVPPKKK